jgi:succinate dehydrogenase/fumarate reductase flavoprotein subunit
VGIDSKGLQDTITRYNGFCAAKVDEDFSRRESVLLPVSTPPYYAMTLGLSLINTQGGPKHNSNSQTLDKSGNPIPRLYSAGELGSFLGYVYAGGSNMAESIAYGRIAGEHAASLKSWT